MSWLSFVDNPKAIEHLYHNIPPLERMEVIQILLDRDGPTLRVQMDFPIFADRRPQRWEPEANTVQLHLDFWEITEIQLVGFSVAPTMDFEIQRINKFLTVRGKGGGCDLKFACVDMRIQRVIGYTKEFT